LVYNMSIAPLENMSIESSAPVDLARPRKRVRFHETSHLFVYSGAPPSSDGSHYTKRERIRMQKKDAQRALLIRSAVARSKPSIDPEKLILLNDKLIGLEQLILRGPERIVADRREHVASVLGSMADHVDAGAGDAGECDPAGTGPCSPVSPRHCAEARRRAALLEESCDRDRRIEDAVLLKGGNAPYRALIAPEPTRVSTRAAVAA